MRNRFVKNLFVAIVLAFGVFAGAWGTADSNTVVAAENSAIEYDVLVSSSKMTINEDDIRNSLNVVYNDVGGGRKDPEHIRYDYYVGYENDSQEMVWTEVDQSRKSFAVEHGKTYFYKIEKAIGEWKIWRVNYGTPTVEVEPTEFTVGVYSDLAINVIGQDVDLDVTGAQLDGEGYRVMYGNPVTVNFPEVEGYLFYLNGTLAEDTQDYTYSVESMTNGVTINAEYRANTANTVVLATETANQLNGAIAELTIKNGEETIDVSTTEVAILEGSELTISATPSDCYLIDSIVVMAEKDSVVTEIETTEDGSVQFPSAGVYFTSDASTKYTIIVNTYDATSTLTINGDTEHSVNNGLNVNAIARNSQVKLTINFNAEGDYINIFSLKDSKGNDVQYTLSYNNVLGTTYATVEFSTTNAIEDYVIDYTTCPVFEALENDLEIDAKDVLAMRAGDGEKKAEIYNAIFNNVYSTSTDISVNDVRIEYIASSRGIDILGYNIPVDFYYPIETTQPANDEGLLKYIGDFAIDYFQKMGISLDGFLLNENTVRGVVETLVKNQASSIRESFKLFGTNDVETVKVIFDGNASIPAVEVIGYVKGVDFRQELQLDLNTEITVAYGSYLNNEELLEKILASRNGVTANGEAIAELNSKLYLDREMAGVDVGDYEVIVRFPDNEADYKGAEQTVTIHVTKATAVAEITSNVINYELVLNGTVNKDYILSVSSDDVIIKDTIEHIYFMMGLDIVDGELVAKLDASNTNTTLKSAIALAMALVDNEKDGLTLVEFVEMVQDLPIMADEGYELDTESLEKIIEILEKVNETIDIRIFITTDGSDITPKNHGVYLTGVVTTDSNYTTDYAAGYFIITAEIVNVDFIESNQENNLRQFEFDGTSKSMRAEAFDINNEIINGTMTYYYLGVQTDGTLYANAQAPINAGAYSVYAIFKDCLEGELPTKVGFGIGGMVILPSDDVEISVNNAVHTYNGENFDLTSMVTINNDDAKVTYITANVNVNGDLFSDGLSAVDGRVNIDFPARFDSLLEKYFPDAYANGVNTQSFINLLNQSKEIIASNGYSADFVDSIVEVLSQMPNVVTITFDSLENIDTSKMGLYLVSAVVFDPNYMPKAGMGVLVIQPDVTVSDMAWNYIDANGVITLPALSKVDFGATIVDSEIEAEISYIYFGLNENGEFVKFTNPADLTNGIWLQLAYVPAEVSSEMNIVKPIARVFAVLPQTANITINECGENDTIVCEYDGQTHGVTASATYLNGKAIDADKISIIYTGVDTMGNRYYSDIAPTNAGTYRVIVSYTEKINGSVSVAGLETTTLVIIPAETEVLVESNTVCYDGESHSIEFVEDANFEYVLVFNKDNKLSVCLPSTWNINLDRNNFVISEELANIYALLESYLANEYVAKIKSAIDEIVARYEVDEIIIENTLPTEIGEYEVTVIAFNPNYEIAFATATLTIQEHTLTTHAGKVATCTEGGWVEYETCSLCNYTTYEEIAALGHTLTHHEAKSATCTEIGWNAYDTCECGYTTYEELPALGHTEMVDNAVSATCTTTGLTEGSHCSVCNTTLVEQEEIAALGHTLTHHNAKVPTCTEIGWNAYDTCECGYTTYEELPALGHTEVVDNAVNATCSSTGLTSGKHCSVCNATLIAQEQTSKIPHTFGDWEVAVAATSTTDGRYERSCTVCNHVEYETIPAYGNKEVGNIEILEGENGKVVVDEVTIDEVLKDVVVTDKKEVVISTDNATEKLTNIEINTSSIEQILNSDCALTIKTNEIHATFDKNALTSIMSSADEDSILFDIKTINKSELNDEQRKSIKKTNVVSVISAQIICGNNTISSFGEGKVQLRIPFDLPEDKSADNYKIMYVAGDGAIEEISTTYDNGALVVELEHFSEYVIAEVSNNEGLSTGTIIAIVITSVFTVLATIGLIVFVRKERKR